MALGRCRRHDGAGRTFAGEVGAGWLSHSGREEDAGRQGGLAIYAYEISAAQESPVKYFAPLKKIAKQDLKGQHSKWLASLFWQLPDITPEAQQEPGADGGVRRRPSAPGPAVGPVRPARGQAAGIRLSTTAAGGVDGDACTRSHTAVRSGPGASALARGIREGDRRPRPAVPIGRPVPGDPDLDGAKTVAALNDARIGRLCGPRPSVRRHGRLVADLMAAEQMKCNCSAPSSEHLARVCSTGSGVRQLKPVLKPASTPDEEQAGQGDRSDSLRPCRRCKLQNDYRREVDLSPVELAGVSLRWPVVQPQGSSQGGFKPGTPRRYSLDSDHKDPARADQGFAAASCASSLELRCQGRLLPVWSHPPQALAEVRAQSGGTDRTGPVSRLVDYSGNRATCTVADDIEFERTALRSNARF